MIVTPASSPQYHWYVEHYDVSDPSPDWSTYQEDQTNTVGTDTGSVDILQVQPGDQIRVRWVDILGGGGPFAANYAEFLVTPPDPACAVDWVHKTEMAEEVEAKNGVYYDTDPLCPTPTDVYDCITDYFTGTPGATPSCTSSCTP